MAKTRELKPGSKITKKDIDKVFVRNLFGLQWGWNYEKMQGLGYCYVIMPILRVLYKDNPEKMKKALKTQLGFFNTSQPMSHLIIGADIALEEEFGIDDADTITSLKTGLMGPFAGVGDTLFIATYRAIIFSIAANLALSGQAIGLIIPLLAVFAIIWLRYEFTWIGYQQGRKIASSLGDQINTFTEGAAILGLTVVGALVPSVINFTLDWNFNVGDVEFSVQDTLNKIMPGLLPLGIVLLSYWLLGQKKMNSTRLLFFLLILGMILGNLPALWS